MGEQRVSKNPRCSRGSYSEPLKESTTPHPRSNVPQPGSLRPERPSPRWLTILAMRHSTGMKSGLPIRALPEKAPRAPNDGRH